MDQFVTPTIRFKHGALEELYRELFKEKKREAYALLLGEKLENIIVIHETRFPNEDDYLLQNAYSVTLKRQFMIDALEAIDHHPSYNTLIEVHTHPFAKGQPNFSKVDDAKEVELKKYLLKTEPSIELGSIVLSPTSFYGRLWIVDEEDEIVPIEAKLQTQSYAEMIPFAQEDIDYSIEQAMPYAFERSRWQKDVISLVGVNSLGALTLQMLIHYGFNHFNLIDSSYEETMRFKEHLLQFNREFTINVYDILDPSFEGAVARSHWVLLMSTDTDVIKRIHHLAQKFFVPLILADSKFLLSENKIDMKKGEILTIRKGDQFCLHCLRRINAYQTYPSPIIPNHHYKKGIIKSSSASFSLETLDAIIASLTVEQLLNNYLKRDGHAPHLLYENDGFPKLYKTEDEIKKRIIPCPICSRKFII